MVHPIIDQYYDRSPYHVRSSAFVQTKGLIANEKAASAMPPPTTLIVEPTAQKRLLGSAMPMGVSRSLASDRISVIKPISFNPSQQSPKAPENLFVHPEQGRREAHPKPVVQGNIKVKRKSLSSPESVQVAMIDSDPDSPVGDSHRQSRSDFGHPQKLARFFPELALN
jgi:glutamine amidotransferase